MRRIATLFMGPIIALGLSSPGLGASQTLIGSNYESYSDFRGCNDVTNCNVSFPQLPAGRTYLIQRVRCKVRTNVYPTEMAFGPSASPQGPLMKETYFEEISSVPFQNVFFVNYEAIPLMMMGGGRYPRVELQMPLISTYTSIQCSLAATVL